ncbi:MAG: ferritin-like domain-containing protein [Acidobacteriota bacterium]
MKMKKSVELLNKAVADELHAVHQYMYFHFHLADLGYMPLAGLLKRIAIEEMGHVEQLAERILYLGGEVEMAVAAEVEKIHDPRKMLECARRMEAESAESYNQWALECARNADSVTKQLFETLVADEERHNDIFDQEVRRVEKFGEQYLALQSFDSNPQGGQPA